MLRVTLSCPKREVKISNGSNDSKGPEQRQQTVARPMTISSQMLTFVTARSRTSHGLAKTNVSICDDIVIGRATVCCLCSGPLESLEPLEIFTSLLGQLNVTLNIFKTKHVNFYYFWGASRGVILPDNFIPTTTTTALKHKVT
jgi:hypothetical protein